MSSRGRKNATSSDVRRMYLRGRKGKIKVDALSLEVALARAKFGPNRTSTKSAPFSRHSEKPVVVVSPKAVQENLAASRAMKSEKRRWSVGHAQSRGIIRPKTPPVQPLVPQESNAGIQSAIPKGRARKKQTQGKSSKAGVSNHAAAPKEETAYSATLRGATSL